MVKRESRVFKANFGIKQKMSFHKNLFTRLSDGLPEVAPNAQKILAE